MKVEVPLRHLFAATLVLLLASPVHAVTCDGSELLCLNLTSAAEVTANGGSVVGGSFSPAGFAPSNEGGLDFAFMSSVHLSEGAIEFDIEGLRPLPGGELSGGKVSLFSICGVAPDDNEYIGFQKMSPDYRDGHVFRYGQDDDGLADNWDSVVITSSEFGCAYNIQNWTGSQTHHIYAEWNPLELYVEIDGAPPCTNMGHGNGDAFNPIDKFVVIGNRCEHLGNQQPLASIRNLRLWGGEAAGAHDDETTVPPCDGPIITSGGLSPEVGVGSTVTFQARYNHCLGAETFRVAQMMVAEEVTAVDPNVHVSFSDGLLHHAGEQCLPGDSEFLQGEWGVLDCAASQAWFAGDELVVEYALILNPDTFDGNKSVFFDAKGGDGDPEPRLGWIQVGTWTVAEDLDESGPDDTDIGDDDTDVPSGTDDPEHNGNSFEDSTPEDDDLAGDPVTKIEFGCASGCGLAGAMTGTRPALAFSLLLMLGWRRLRGRQTCRI